MSPENFVFLSDCAKGYVVRLEQIVLIQAAGNYAHVTLDDGRSISIRASLIKLLNSLDPKVFFQPNREYICNLRHVKEAEQHGKGMLLFTLSNGKQLGVSRGHSSELRRRFHLP